MGKEAECPCCHQSGMLWSIGNLVCIGCETHSGYCLRCCKHHSFGFKRLTTEAVVYEANCGGSICVYRNEVEFFELQEEGCRCSVFAEQNSLLLMTTTVVKCWGFASHVKKRATVARVLTGLNQSLTRQRPRAWRWSTGRIRSSVSEWFGRTHKRPHSPIL